MAATRHGNYNKGHQRRQSVARLLPDISKLRLLSWLVEASNELINCDIAIMDGVYAKLNRSRESLLFWQQNHHQYHQTTPTSAISGSRSSCGQLSVTPLRQQAMPPPPPPPPSKQPVSGGNNNRIVISQQQQQQQQNKLHKKLSLNSSNKLSIKSSNHLIATSDSKKQKKRNSGGGATSSSSSFSVAARNHHSLPMTNYDASSLAAISLRSTKTMPATTANSDNKSLFDSRSTCSHQPGDLSAAAAAASRLKVPILSCDHHPTDRVNGTNARLVARRTTANQRNCNCDTTSDEEDDNNLGDVEDGDDDDDEEEEVEDDSDDDDDDNNSTSSSGTTGSTSSSGIHGNSLTSSSASTSGSSSSSTFEQAVGGASSTTTTNASGLASNRGTPIAGRQFSTSISPAEYLSDRIRQVLVEHQYLQSLLVNVIRQHDRQRDSISRRRSPSQLTTSKIDLADIASSLDDGCLCSCHSDQMAAAAAAASSMPTSRASTLPLSAFSGGNSATPTAASTTGSGSTTTTTPIRNKATTLAARRLKKIRGGSSAASSCEPTRDEMIQQMSDRLCENCFETHQWLLACSTLELTTGGQLPASAGSKHARAPNHDEPLVVMGSSPARQSDKQLEAHREHLEALIGLRNATFIKLVQQQVRSTISKSIELIDLIRREIKSPESIKQKQLMFCFSSSIQLLSSVANYVVPSQDISSFIPEVGQRQTKLFSLPTSDFDHLLMYQPASAMIFPPLGGIGLGGAVSSAAGLAADSNSAGQYHLAQVPEILPRRSRLAINQAAAATTTSLARRQATAAAASLLLGSSNNSELAAGAGPQSLPVAIGSSSSSTGLLSAATKSALTGSGECLATNMQKLRTTEEIVGGGEGAITSGANSTNTNNLVESSSGASSNNSSASSSIARSQVQQSSLTRAHTSSSMILRDVERLGCNSTGGPGGGGASHNSNSISISGHPGSWNQQADLQQQQQQRHNITFDTIAAASLTAANASGRRPHLGAADEDLMFLFNGNGGGGGPGSGGVGGGGAGQLRHGSSPKFWQSSKFNFIKKLLHVKQQRLLRQQSKDRRIYNNKVQNKFRLVMMDLTHFNKSQQLLTTENGVNSLLTSMRNVLEFGLYLTVKLY